jgi:hypothetical protein
VTAAIERDICNGHIHTKLSATQLMLILWGQILGFMQIIIMRKKSFEEAYDITPESLFEEYLRMAIKSLQ